VRPALRTRFRKTLIAGVKPLVILLLTVGLPAASHGEYEISGLIGNTSYDRLEGVVVTLAGAAEAQDTTDADGSYAFTGLAGGDYVVEPKLAGWSSEPATRVYTALDADSLEQHFIGTQVEFTISGLVISSFGYLMEGAVVTLTGDAEKADTTGPDGFYSFPGLRAGDYMVTPSGAGYDFSPASRSYTGLAADTKSQNFIATARSGSVRLVGGENGYVDPEAGETATLIVVPRVSGSVRVTVYTLRGEIVFEASQPVEADEENTFEWDCRNQGGQVVAPGVYVFKVDGAGMSETRKIAVVR
jgi:hypothetical protein